MNGIRQAVEQAKSNIAYFEESYTSQLKLILTQDEFKKTILPPDWVSIIDEVVPAMKDAEDIDRQMTQL